MPSCDAINVLPWRTAPDFLHPRCRTLSRRFPASQRTSCRWRTGRRPWSACALPRLCGCAGLAHVQVRHASWTEKKLNFYWVLKIWQVFDLVPNKYRQIWVLSRVSDSEELGLVLLKVENQKVHKKLICKLANIELFVLMQDLSSETLLNDKRKKQAKEQANTLRTKPGTRNLAQCSTLQWDRGSW